MSYAAIHGDLDCFGANRKIDALIAERDALRMIETGLLADNDDLAFQVKLLASENTTLREQLRLAKEVTEAARTVMFGENSAVVHWREKLMEALSKLDAGTNNKKEPKNEGKK